MSKIDTNVEALKAWAERLSNEAKPTPLFQTGDKVVVTILDVEYQMVVMGLCSQSRVAGVWINNYHVRFTKKDGTVNRVKSGRFFSEDRLKKLS